MPNYEKGSERFQSGLEDLIPLKRAAEICGLSHSHLRRLVRDGEIEGRKLGRDWFTTLKAVREYEARDRRPGPKPK
jgi:hypothetical protein